MGEVYRATDTSLKRPVAIKVLPDALAEDADRLARFQREAEVLARLNHPNIAQIHGLERRDGTTALVLELVEGPTLADRIAQGAVPIDEAVSIAKQIAEALEAAHEQGIIHRDLKPANVKVRGDGTVKVLDFGLAKALEPEGPSLSASDSRSPTITSPAMTQQGVILGTAAYMSPEQARGRAVDRRADIWAFGCVLFEMLSGQQAFTGDTVSDVLASVLKHDLDWGALPAELPGPVAALLRRCLTPDPRLRLRDIGEARIALTDPATTAPSLAGTEARASSPAPPSRRWLAGVTVVLGLALVALSARLWDLSRPEPRPIIRYAVDAPAGGSLSVVGWPALSLSPDGGTLAFVATREGVARLYVRRRDQLESRLLNGTEGAANPVFSPDGRWLAFFADNQLKKTSLDGDLVTLAKVNDPRGVTWLDENTLVYSPEAVGGLMLVSASGGEPKVLSTPDSSKAERSHRWPLALPGGKTVLFTVGLLSSPDDYDGSDIDAVAVGTGERHTVLRRASMALIAPGGDLLFARGGSMYAQTFDDEAVQTTGTPVPVQEGVAGDRTTGAAHLVVAGDGTLAFVPGTTMGNSRRLVWADAKGAVEAVDLPPAVYNDLRIAPDGTRAAILVGTSGSGDVWIDDFPRGTFTRLTFTGVNATPLWSVDGRSIYYVAIDSTGLKTTILRKRADGSADAEVVATIDSRAYLEDIDVDGGLVLDQSTMSTGAMGDIVRLVPGSSTPPSRVVASPADEYAATLSPDGRWLAYQSNESGRYEVYVRELAGGGRWQVSIAGGEEPHWSHNGRELYYRQDDVLMRAAIDLGAGFRVGTPETLLKGIYNLRSDTGMSYDVSPRDGRFLMIRSAEDERVVARIAVVLNWSEELEAKVKGGAATR